MKTSWHGNTFRIITLKPRQNGRQIADDIFSCIFLNEDTWYLISISLKFVPKGPISNIPALVQIMAWHRPDHNPLSEPMTVSLLTHIFASLGLMGRFVANRPVTGGFPSPKAGNAEVRRILFWAWTSCWTNMQYAGDLRCHDAHFTSLTRFAQYTNAYRIR